LAYEQKELEVDFAFWHPTVDRIVRYQSAINRQFFQAKEQLDRLKATEKRQSTSPKNSQAEPKGGVPEPAATDNHSSDTSERDPSLKGGKK
jgi:hypothetical protein